MIKADLNQDVTTSGARTWSGLGPNPTLFGRTSREINPEAGKNGRKSLFFCLKRELCMLKSVPTQLAATLFFGPVGLAYCSVAAAVFFTLLLAVLVFTEVGIYAVFLIWPVSILVGLVFVKLHNDGVRSSGSRLLLGPGDEMDLATTIGSWTRGLAVMALVVTAGYLAYLYVPKDRADSSQLGRIVDAQTDSATDTAEKLMVVATQDSKDEAVNTSAAVIAANSQNSSDNFAVIALPQREVTTVVLDSEGQVTNGDSQSSLNSGQPELTVTGAVVNLRQGPGTGFPIITQVEQGDKLFEFARDGQWINVETATTGYSGWIYRTLVQ